MFIFRSFAALVVIALPSLWVSAQDQPVPTPPSSVTIDGQYPGGNIVVERIEGDQVVLRPDLRDTEGWWFYWNFRVRGAAGRTLTFRFTGQNPIGVRGPAFSTDRGATWAWLGADRVQDASFTYAFAESDDEVRFCFAIPYQQEQLDRFLALHRDNPSLSVKPLCETRQGRRVERIHIAGTGKEPAHRILLTARHHACESIASYALEGFLAATLADTEDGRWFRDNVEVLAIPFVDKDGVENGDQGKNRRPHDHNRDYGGESIYPTVAAIRSFVPGWSRGHLSMAMDLHCPWIRGPHNEVIYMVGKSDPLMWQRQSAFGNLLERVQRGPLKYRAADNLPFGQAWNTGANYGDHVSCSAWAGQLAGIGLATTFEIPYANAAGRVVDADAARAFGHDLMTAVRQYLSPPPDSTSAVDRGNRLAYLDEPANPYWPGLQRPRLITPQWIGEEDVKAAFVLAIDDMTDVGKYESFLRPILERLKKIDGRAPVSIMTKSIDPQLPQLQDWLEEGLSIETHTDRHPCPCLQGGSLAEAKATYDRCVDALSEIPNM
ncbi:MAG: hypothetical protein JJ992_08650, partial [Planctomycetes bacterium]|nr:hypothetical protein [Planctomycetota bacterium]